MQLLDCFFIYPGKVGERQRKEKGVGKAIAIVEVIAWVPAAALRAVGDTRVSVGNHNQYLCSTFHRTGGELSRV